MKIKISPGMIFYKFIISLFVFTFCTTGFAQSNPNYSPVKWEKYSTKDFKASFLMPKLPVVVNESRLCRGEEAFSYGSFARGAAYVVKITRKIDVPRNCAEKQEFDKNRFKERVAALKNTPLELKERADGKPNEVVLEGNKRIYKLINDSKNEQWFELMVIGADETIKEAKEFLASLKIKKPEGIEIGSGAAQTLGDEPEQTFDSRTKNAGETDEKESWKLRSPKTSRNDGIGILPVTPSAESSSKNPLTEGVIIALKPRANYTDSARANKTQGKVVLRVTFGSHGGIGAISVISGIADGLTEQAIAAARRIVFVPAKRNGVAYSVTKPVEYTFTIY